MKLISILESRISTTSYSQATSQIANWAKNAESRSVYAANVHMLMEAYDSIEFKQIVNTADLVTPDGMPLVWVMKRKGIKDQQRVYGPTLMFYLLDTAAQEKIPVGFYGSTEETLSKLETNLTRKFPSLSINFSCSPPFRPLSDEENNIIVDEINNSGVRILFVSLGCPKQERWIADHRGKINAVMVGVGAAFEFHAGVISQAPAWIQKIGLEWLYRLIQEPRRLWKRYLWNNPRFIFLIARELLLSKGEKNA